MADPYQLQQVWLNLIQNAQQAMHDAHGEGVLQVRTLITPESKIRVEFADDGPGIAPDVMEEIFDPFFTTKPVGEGTGLGLSICYGIIVQHEGQIWAENNPEGGSTFIVVLPGRDDDVSEPSPEEYHAPPESTASARVLVVDDEAPILELVERMLTRHGYMVDTARDGKEAIERIAHQDYDLILLDLLMPQKGGIATYEEIVEHRPELAKQVIFATGDVATSSTRAFLEETGAPFIAKPFDLPELRQMIRSKLEEHVT
jgi:CheY-like chemotaxis protein